MCILISAILLLGIARLVFTLPVGMAVQFLCVVESLTVHHTSILKASISTVALAFLHITLQRRCPKIRPLGAQRPDNTLPHLPEVYRKPLAEIRTHSGDPNGVHFRGVPLCLECDVMWYN